MTLPPGTKLGVYDVVAVLGRGGMGEVYRARDTRLGRDVALKVLPAAFAADPDRLSRFEREAQVLASLNHPNIGAIYGLEESGPTAALVLELIEGPTLADRLARGPLASAEALEIARQIAEALEAAHDRGVIHRDLKPANVAMTADGSVKVLDFGLAKVLDAANDGELGESPTMAATRPGTVLGTPYYMSPEQATGKDADRATDVWAFGCVLYEMLGGRRAFDGPSAGDVLANVLKTDPDFQRLPAGTPESIRRLLRRSLEKDHKRRLRDLRDARLEIAEAQGGPPPRESDTKRSSGRERWAWATAAVLSVATTALAVSLLRPRASAPEIRLEIGTPASRSPAVEVSPDGLKVVSIAASGGTPLLWLRVLAEPAPRALAGTDRTLAMFWGPDSRSIAFVADAALKVINLDDGAVRILTAPVPAPLGGAWNKDGTILFSPNPGGPIMRMSASGGEPTPATRFSAQQRSQSSPRFLRDGRHFLFFVIGSAEVRGVYLGELGVLDTRRLFDAEGPAVQTAAGPLLFVRQGTLWAQDFDMTRLEPRGDPVAVDTQAGATTNVSTSEAGPIVYRTGPTDRGQRQLVWFNRSGNETKKVVYADTAPPGPALSRDGRHLAIYRFLDGNMDIWAYDTERGTWDRLTDDAGDDIFPLWSTDGAEIIWGSRRAGRMDLFRKSRGASTESEELLLSSPEIKFPMDWSRDGRFLLYNVVDAKRGMDLWVLPLEDRREPRPVVRTDYNEQFAQFSLDAKWIAYQSDRTGRPEIYLRPFPGQGQDVLVSSQGGSLPRWSADGTELFFVEPEARLMTVSVRFSADGASVKLAQAHELFSGVIGGGFAPRQPYLVARDGKSFVVSTTVGQAMASPTKVILNWRPPGK